MDECRDCSWYDEREYYRGKGYCSYYRDYYYPNSSACSHFQDKNYYSPCYITTIVCHKLGMDDYCNTLKKLRLLRDGVMQKDEKYAEVLKEYDVVGPEIAKSIEDDSDKDLCKKVYDGYLSKIVKKVESKDFLSAIVSYEQMTTLLATYYGVSLESANNIRNYDYTRGGHGKLYEKK